MLFSLKLLSNKSGFNGTYQQTMNGLSAKHQLCLELHMYSLMFIRKKLQVSSKNNDDKSL